MALFSPPGYARRAYVLLRLLSFLMSPLSFDKRVDGSQRGLTGIFALTPSTTAKNLVNVGQETLPWQLILSRETD